MRNPFKKYGSFPQRTFEGDWGNVMVENNMEHPKYGNVDIEITFNKFIYAPYGAKIETIKCNKIE